MVELALHLVTTVVSSSVCVGTADTTTHGLISVQHELGMQEEMIVAIWAVPAACTGPDRPKPKRTRQPRAGSACEPPQQLHEYWEAAGSQGS